MNKTNLIKLVNDNVQGTICFRYIVCAAPTEIFGETRFGLVEKIREILLQMAANIQYTSSP